MIFKVAFVVWVCLGIICVVSIYYYKGRTRLIVVTNFPKDTVFTKDKNCKERIEAEWDASSYHWVKLFVYDNRPTTFYGCYGDSQRSITVNTR